MHAAKLLGYVVAGQLFCVDVYALPAGKYLGSGEGYFDTEGKVACQEIAFEVITSDTTVTVTDLTMTCGSIPTAMREQKLEIQNGDLLQGGKVVGRVGDGEISWDLTESDYPLQWIFSVKKDQNDRWRYHDEYRWDGELTHRVVGFVDWIN